MTTPTANSLTVAVAHAVSFLTRPLVLSHPTATVQKLQMVLEANLTALYAPLWDVRDPLRHASRRCISLSATCLPPRCIYAACIASGVQWFDWMTLLGGEDFDFFVDPGCVYLRVLEPSLRGGKLVTIWADEVMFTPPPVEMAPPAARKTMAQLLIEDDYEEEDRLFATLANEINEPVWTTPVIEKFPTQPRSISPLSTISSHSRSSSYSSDSVFSLTDSSSSASSTRSSRMDSAPRMSRRERAREARVYVDKSRNQVTNYETAKTTVLGGGVMLGGHC